METNQINFYSKYHEHLYNAHRVAINAKQYILKHWKKVDDWSDLNVWLYDRKKDEKVLYCNYKNNANSDILDKQLKKMHNPINKIEEVVWDDIDGDFSITIDGIEFLWIYDKAIIVIADYIESKLNEQ